MGKLNDLEGFKAMKELADRVQQQRALDSLVLSMGTSMDYEMAITEGATEVRLGSTIFGERNYAAKKWLNLIMSIYNFSNRSFLGPDISRNLPILSYWAWTTLVKLRYTLCLIQTVWNNTNLPPLFTPVLLLNTLSETINSMYTTTLLVTPRISIIDGSKSVALSMGSSSWSTLLTIIALPSLSNFLCKFLNCLSYRKYQ